MVDTAQLLARIRQRKQELKSWEWWETKPSRNVYHILGNATDHEELPLDLHLTKWEQKRKRKLDREALREDTRVRIGLGIDEPPAPKLKLSNVAAVYGPAYAHSPTEYEMKAREAEESRRRQHLLANEERRLSKEDRWEKHRSKVELHRDAGIFCAAFFFPTALDSKGQFVVDYTAKKFLCSGACMLGDSDAFVIVETGEPELAKLVKFMTVKFEGRLVWKGRLLHPNFKRWSVHTTPYRREFLKTYGVGSLFDQATAN